MTYSNNDFEPPSSYILHVQNDCGLDKYWVKIYQEAMEYEGMVSGVGRWECAMRGV
jgi:hypothetical protein